MQALGLEPPTPFGLLRRGLTMDLENRKNTTVNNLVSFKRILDRGIQDEDAQEEEEEHLFIKTAKAEMFLKRKKQKERQKKEEIERKLV